MNKDVNKFCCAILLIFMGFVCLLYDPDGSMTATERWILALLVWSVVIIDIRYKKNLIVPFCKVVFFAVLFIALFAIYIGVYLPIVLYIKRQKRKERERLAKRLIRESFPWWCC